MSNINSSLLDELVDIIYQRIEEKFNKQLNSANVEFSYEGIVRNPVQTTDSSGNVIGTTSADVELAFNTLTSLPNLSGSILAEGNKVKIFYNKSNMSNAYIGVKF